ncbi:response regulator [Alkalimarinus alittae]|uniref:Response regulator transcription factor n=1 Tax=Alkalimarinus alittae TaxID=2961619 RepID=A0ABY6N1P5_9ALTE|nr:response regulator transcription factor [Alkalimarinus alittae]UZE96038.1 response regulator transcription factor [Alkalimarinus alittae]
MNTNNTMLQTASVRFLIVEDHPLFLEGLTLALQKMPSHIYLQSVGSAQAAKAALTQSADYDLILLDLHLPDGQGLTLLRYLQLKRIFIPVAIISASEDQSDVRAAISAGASGFISKANNSAAIVSAIERVLAGEECLPDFYHPPQQNQPTLATQCTLTPRQLEVLELLAEGLPNKRICQRLELTEHTVKTHLKTLFQLLEVHNRTECVQKAAKLGFLG